MRLFLFALAAMTAWWVPQDSRAAASDALLDGARLCTKLLPSYERQYRIPKYLLTAIAVTESGRWHHGLATAVPWPWTVNAGGKGHYFATKDKAVDFVHSLRRRGISSMDVGCMQVNLLHHPNAFANLQQAFEPNNNIRYAAQFLRENYAEQRSWKKAAAAYHSKTPALGSRYARRVHESWKRIVAHVKKKRRGGAAASAASRTAPMGAFDLAAAKDAFGDGKKPRRRPTMKVIEVKSGRTADTTAATHVENGVKVTRAAPETSVSRPAPASLADVGPPANPAPARAALPIAATPPKVITVGKNGKATVKKTGPRFIFD